MSDFLFEIGLEEIPARMIAGAQAELLKRVLALLTRERLLASPDAAAHSYSTPRRLAVHVPAVLDRQPDLTEELLGPATKIAYKDGVPGPAAIAFAKKSGVPLEDLRTVATAKGDYLAATSMKPGRNAADVLTTELPKELAGIYWAKNMYWRAGKPERFVRPVRWLVALLGAEVVPVQFAGYTAGRLTYGHRVLFGAQPIVLQDPSDYAAKLSAAHVMADVVLRRHTIRKALDHVCRTIPGTRWREDHALVDKMTHMTEWPSVIAGGFDADYLALPEEVLVTVMRDHQNYFAVEAKDSNLAPHFLAVLNTQADEQGQAVIRHGNARVLRARFNDAKFFWEFDQRTPLEERVALLEHVTFQKDLGSYAAKATRVRTLCDKLAQQVARGGIAIDFNSLFAAASLAKTDLTCELVKEFTELQGQIGGLYARAQGFTEATANAIYDQYRPASMEDRIPRTVEGQVLAIADKIDTIAGLFALGMEPTGSKDPFALRRAANGIVKILAESALPLTLSELIEASATRPDVAEKMSVFFRERLEFYLREARDQAYDVVKAVLSVDVNNVRDALARAQAVTDVRSADTTTFTALVSGLKRMRNILDQARGKGELWSGPVQSQLLSSGAEEDLESTSKLVAKDVASFQKRHDYKAAVVQIAMLRPQVDAFFEDVVVMAPEAELRANRLALLDRILTDFSGIADFSEIVTAG